MNRSDEMKKGMNIKHMKRRCLILTAIIACALSLGGTIMIAGQEEDQHKPPESSEQQPPIPQKQDPIKGYPVRDRQMGGPTDVEWDLDNSFPKPNSVLELILRCRESQRQ